jgi:hypothetical protein
MRTDRSRFDNLKQHPDFVAAPSQPVLPADGGITIAAVAAPLLLSLFGCVFLLIVISLLATMGAPLIVWLLFLGGGLVFVFGGVRLSRGMIALRDAPIQRVIAVIVKERTDVSGGDSSTSTSYYATLQTEDGTRTEYKVSGALAGRIVLDDIGVAYVKETIVDFGFTRVPTRTLVEFIPIPV